MPELIQRVPRGLLELLSISGGIANKKLLDEVRGVVDQLQFYGLQQQRLVLTNNAALAEGGNVAVTNVTVGCQYALLFGANFTAIKTATATALRGAITVIRNGSNGLTVASAELGPFGATETGPAECPWQPAYPWLLIPPWEVRGNLRILGTDANANCTITAEIGVLT